MSTTVIFCVFINTGVKYSMAQIPSTDKCCDFIFTNSGNFWSLEVVDRGSETRLQVTENLN